MLICSQEHCTEALCLQGKIFPVFLKALFLVYHILSNDAECMHFPIFPNSCKQFRCLLTCVHFLNSRIRISPKKFFLHYQTQISLCVQAGQPFEPDFSLLYQKKLWNYIYIFYNSIYFIFGILLKMCCRESS